MVEARKRGERMTKRGRKKEEKEKNNRQECRWKTKQNGKRMGLT